MTINNERLIGAHMPTAGGLDKSLLAGAEIGCTAVQVFTSSPRQWAYAPLDPEMAERFKANQKSAGIGFTVAHDSYLINLAAPSEEVLQRSREAFRAELDRAEMLGIPWVVTHMGACMGSSEDAGVALLCESSTMILRETEGMAVGVAMETTAGQGTCLGHRFEQIARVLDGCGGHDRMGVCLDTCHIFAAGYDIRGDEAYDHTIAEFDRIIGLDRLKVIHANDSKKGLGSKVDRHEHIGEGEIGLNAFRRIMTDPRLAHVPVVVETPDSDTMHAVNVAKLKRLASGEEIGIRVSVRLFGHYRDYQPEVFSVEVAAGATPALVASTIVSGDARLAGLELICRAAVNEEYAPMDQPLQPGDEIAFIPPMSGG